MASINADLPERLSTASEGISIVPGVIPEISCRIAVWSHKLHGYAPIMAPQPIQPHSLAISLNKL
jgi:hypothetical protein